MPKEMEEGKPGEGGRQGHVSYVVAGGLGYFFQGLEAGRFAPDDERSTCSDQSARDRMTRVDTSARYTNNAQEFRGVHAKYGRLGAAGTVFRVVCSQL